MKQYNELFQTIERHTGKALLQSDMDEIVRACESLNGIAALRAENAKLRGALIDCLEWLEEGQDEINERCNAVLNSTTPDPLYQAAPEMLEALKRVWPYLQDWQNENNEDYSIGIYEDRELTAAYLSVKAIVEPVQPMYADANPADRDEF